LPVLLLLTSLFSEARVFSFPKSSIPAVLST
jgi:hypothetical protein